MGKRKKKFLIEKLPKRPVCELSMVLKLKPITRVLGIFSIYIYFPIGAGHHSCESGVNHSWVGENNTYYCI